MFGIILKGQPGPKLGDAEFTPEESGPFEPVSTVFQPYWEYWSGSQPRAQGQFRLGLHGEKVFDGEFVKWFFNGKKEQSIMFSDGIKHGRYTEWYENGEKKREGLYQDGKAVGQWVFWYASGRKKAELDVTIGMARFWEANGQEASDANYEQLAKSLLD